MNRWILGCAVAGAVAVAVGCGGSSSTSPSPDTSITCSSLPNATTILITNTGVCPQALTVTRGTQVTFINNDTRAHQIDSDPHPEHTDCPEIDDVGHLDPRQSKQTGNLNTPRRCGYHDHIFFSDRSLQGTITIQ